EYSMKYVDPRAITKRTLKLKASNLLLYDIYGQIVELDLDNFKSIYLVGAGKATAAMAEALYKLLNGRISAGAINVPYNTRASIERLSITEANHPIPDEAGVIGTKKILNVLSRAKNSDLVFVLLSGGGSALMTLPAKGITIRQKQRIINSMLSAGASIEEINIVRKHLSMIKGGQLLKFLKSRCRVICLILSDVIGNRIDIVASGPTTPDSSTFKDASSILRKYNIWRKVQNSSVEEVINKGIHGIISDTPKPGDPLFQNVSNILIGGNVLVCQKAKMYLKKHGLQAVYLGSSFDGEAKNFGALLAHLSSIIKKTSRPFAFVLGGETTVKLNGRKNIGTGGRNQEAILAAALKSKLSRDDDITILCMGTDGIDGKSNAAGGFVTPKTVSMVRERERQMRKYLDNHDSYNALSKLHSLIVTGQTGTNVNDVSIVCRLK
ncbi:MAG TPA: glycerate kinase, partial [Nitrososphaeraceae archaeon]|nr:glycerate kinase [Nitrososphaeraceae archaeon]